MKTAREWVEECQNNHPNCPRAGKPKLPTRVIDVGLESEITTVKLHISHATEFEEYVALSYCWGGPQPLVTTTKNLACMIYDIPLDKLPQTILDAIKVTKHLNIRYLWIDALCIIQNSDADQREEIDRMGQIYKKATVTIAAASAKSVSEGFLQIRAALEHHTLPFLTPGGSLGKVFVMRQLAYDSMHPLNKRGWTLQESLLSPRKLLYGERELVWYCESEQSKQFPGSALRCFSMFGILPSEVFQQDGDVQIRPPGDHKLWSRIVNEYTKRSLTFREDRLRALAGITNELTPIFRDQCVFGMWHRNFLRQLGWLRTVSVDGDTGRELLSCAPGWSWASGYFTVGFMGFQPYELSWELLSRTFVIKAKVQKASNMEPRETGTWRYYWDVPSMGGPQYGFGVEYEGREIYYLLLGYEPGREYRLFALILIEVEDQAFRRVGIVQTVLPTTVFDNCQEKSIRII